MKLTSKVLSITLFASVSLVAVACSEIKITEGPAPGMWVDSTYAGIRMNSVAILDRSLQEWYIWEDSIKGPIEQGKDGKIAVESLGSRRSPTQTLEVWTMLRNRTNYPLQLEGRTQFFDQNKSPIEGPTAWQRLMLPPNSSISYKEFSTLVQGISYYYIEIREGK